MGGFGGAEEAREGELVGEFLKIGHGRVIDEGSVVGGVGKG